MNQNLINSCDLDDFDKLIIIEGWFYYFTDGQKKNLVRILNEKITESSSSQERHKP